MDTDSHHATPDSTVSDHYQTRIPAGTMDGAVVELQLHDDGIIPGPAARLAHECDHQASNFTPCRICGA